ncbi:purple acid phosphatase family protein [Dethiosulfatarculus sandiegensis]|uniref:Fibronectin type-III domain-containing protein n=1 Tax=Dethiosulfatarculus sandiegensis TaxID=1429043 RepID=A0A0D2JRB2_9BACT|nr:metallophosphoesterase family protein [Dethiosulfatarculus sandiegensis]KIX12000.1 hypothetical protein X474_21095 [Dethiosulfatarculus sandiegensis]
MRTKSWFFLGWPLVLANLLLFFAGCAPVEEKPPAALYTPPRLHAYAASDNQINLGWFPGKECSCPTCVCRLVREKEILTQDARQDYEDTGLKPDTTYEYRMVGEEGVVARVTARTRPEQIIRKTPYLIFNDDPHTMTVMWQTTGEPDSTSIQWSTDPQFKRSGGKDSSYGELPVGVDSLGLDENLYSFTIKNLSPDTTIFYRVFVNSETYKGSFKTPPSRQAPEVSFYAYGNTRRFPQAHDLVAAGIRQDIAQDPARRQTICLHTGDFVTFGMDESYWDSEFFNPDFEHIQKFLGSVPLVGALGRHEIARYPWFLPPGDGTGGHFFHKYWPLSMLTTRLPKSKDFYYSFDYGQVHFIVLDPFPTRMDPKLGFEVSWNAWPVSAQYKWLEQDLNENQGKWLVVMINSPLYAPIKSDPKVREFFEPLFQKYGVNLVLQGENPFYAREDVEGISYVTLGGGGAALKSPWPKDGKPPKDYQGVFALDYHFARVDVNPEAMVVSVMKPGGQEIDTFSINRPVKGSKK